MAEGRQLIADRQKMLKLADWSKYGWLVVKEYEEDGLADDSEDEKRIEKAEWVVESRMQAKRRKEAVRKRGCTTGATSARTRGKAVFISV